ncbi:39S ribosomal protein L12, mitochondrial-like [Anneissia japonica]|uniref:39S ribosomal protein L12, mitochondrial-like n=1 Tax=Anneissia japonica TaxID=1529436 RepID=UPI0014256483|nr:39S ribosomal protein L12, mitochondrial-like [Anneissia japonica]
MSTYFYRTLWNTVRTHNKPWRFQKLQTQHLRLRCTCIHSRALCTSPLPSPTLDGEPKNYSEKIRNIVEEIASLNLLEVSQLNQHLKETLNIQDAPVMAYGAPPSQAQQKEEEDEDSAPAKEVKTSFTITLTKFDAASKVKLIKSIKALNPTMNLVQAKKFVESVPQVLKADVGKDEAEDIKKQITEVGGECEIE